jgi:hypothetical protein
VDLSAFHGTQGRRIVNNRYTPEDDEGSGVHKIWGYFSRLAGAIPHL